MLASARVMPARSRSVSAASIALLPPSVRAIDSRAMFSPDSVGLASRRVPAPATP